MTTIIITYQKRKVEINLGRLPEKTDLEDVAKQTAEILTQNFNHYIFNKKGKNLTQKSIEKYNLSQFVLIKLKLIELKNKGVI